MPFFFLLGFLLPHPVQPSGNCRPGLPMPLFGPGAWSQAEGGPTQGREVLWPFLAWTFLLLVVQGAAPQPSGAFWELSVACDRPAYRAHYSPPSPTRGLSPVCLSESTLWSCLSWRKPGVGEPGTSEQPVPRDGPRAWGARTLTCCSSLGLIFLVSNRPLLLSHSLPLTAPSGQALSLVLGDRGAAAPAGGLCPVGEGQTRRHLSWVRRQRKSHCPGGQLGASRRPWSAPGPDQGRDRNRGSAGLCVERT